MSHFPEIKWEVFSKHSKETYQKGSVLIQPVNSERFLESMASAEGVLCGAGFQTPAEVLYLHKKLIVIPMKGQYEQQCNAAALKLMGVPVLKSLKIKQRRKLKVWLESHNKLVVDFPDETESILYEILENYEKQRHPIKPPEKSIESSSRFREFLLKKIFYQLGA